MSFHYWRNRGLPQKTKFVTLQDSYHGETLGTLAVNAIKLRSIIRLTCIQNMAGRCKLKGVEKLTAMAALLEKQAHEIAAVIVEPLVQCAGGMRMYHSVYLKLLRQACEQYNIHLIADEMAVGFGRTGTMFACEQANITPDFLCLSKGLTGGYLPLAVVLTNDDIYQAFYDDYTTLKAFLHSHSYTG